MMLFAAWTSRCRSHKSTPQADVRHEAHTSCASDAPVPRRVWSTRVPRTSCPSIPRHSRVSQIATLHPAVAPIRRRSSPPCLATDTYAPEHVAAFGVGSSRRRKWTRHQVKPVAKPLDLAERHRGGRATPRGGQASAERPRAPLPRCGRRRPREQRRPAATPTESCLTLAPNVLASLTTSGFPTEHRRRSV